MFKCIKNLFYSLDPFYKVTKEENLIILTPKDENYHINSVFIFLHGLGENAQRYLSTFQSSYRPVPNTTKVILPNAPLSHVGIMGGELMNSWYDIKGMSDEQDVSQEDVFNNTAKIIELIHKEAKKVEGGYQQIFVGGFSQGASMALTVGLNIKENIGGIIALSGVLFPFCTKNVNIEEKKDLPIYIGHGTLDEKININLAKLSYDYFISNNFKNVKFNEFPIAHSISSTELKDINDFIYINAIKHYI